MRKDTWDCLLRLRLRRFYHDRPAADFLAQHLAEIFRRFRDCISPRLGQARAEVGLLHGLLNVGATVLYSTSLVLRRKQKRNAGMGFAMLGFAVSSASAYLGGHLVFGEQIGVNHAAAQEMPKEFVPVLADGELREGEMKRADAGGVPVLLVRCEGEVCALAHTCSHLGGPLSEGKLEGDVVQCPWHGSRFTVRDGSVVDGPATFPQPRFETRVREGQIEVRSIDR